MAKTSQTIIVKRNRKQSHKSHGGSWKIAYADFVTAMMAFFLVMWMSGALGNYDLQGIAEYFKNPNRKESPSGGQNVGERTQILPGGGSDLTDPLPGQVSPIVRKRFKELQEKVKQLQQKNIDLKKAVEEKHVTKDDLDKAQMQIEHAQMQQLKFQIESKLKSDPEFSKFNSQVKLEITKDGLKIQLEDLENHPMFPISGTTLYPTPERVIEWLGKSLNDISNKVVISGYTDSTPFRGASYKKYTNWELSADRANACRRALIAGGMKEDKIIKVSGFSSIDPQDTKNPLNPINRRISIILLYSDKQKTEEKKP